MSTRRISNYVYRHSNNDFGPPDKVVIPERVMTEPKEEVMLPEPGDEPDDLVRQILCNFNLQCTVEEVAAAADLDVEELDELLMDRLGAPAQKVREMEIQRGRLMLRQQLWDMSQKNPTMAIFLAKNYLGMDSDGGRTAEGAVIINDLPASESEDGI